MEEGMEAEGIEHGLLGMDPWDPGPFAEMAGKVPGRFLLSTVIDPTQGVQAVRHVERLVKEYDIRLIRRAPFLISHRIELRSQLMFHRGTRTSERSR